MITHKVKESGIVSAIAEISATDYVTAKTRVIRIEEV
jgi:hypothetical protein